LELLLLTERKELSDLIDTLSRGRRKKKVDLLRERGVNETKSRNNSILTVSPLSTSTACSKSTCFITHNNVITLERKKKEKKRKERKKERKKREINGCR